MSNNIDYSGAKYSSIVGISEKLKQKSIEENKEFLYLNRGINQVVNINLKPITDEIDFNSKKIQYYPPNQGMPHLKAAINNHFFQNSADTNNITITAGGMHGLQLSLSSLKNPKVYTPNLFWGAYTNVLKILKKEHLIYPNIKHIVDFPELYAESTVIICDPNNPSGEKAPDELILNAAKATEKYNTSIIFDCPYRKLFTDDNDEIYKKLSQFSNVIICESFSKSVGLSGQRIGFTYCKDKEFNKEFSIRLLFSENGVNSFAQELVYQLLTNPKGLEAVYDFRATTKKVISLNIKHLIDNNLLAKELYIHDTIWGIFAIVNKSQATLEKHLIGSVGLDYFTNDKKINTDNYTRICVSVPHEKFTQYIDNIL